MANSDIENCGSELKPSPRVSACTTPAPVRDLKSFLARQERAPLESSNTSNCVLSNNSNQLLHAVAATQKKRQQSLNGNPAAAVGQFSRRLASDGGQPCGEASLDDVESRRRRWDMLSTRLVEDDGAYSLLHDPSAAAGAAGATTALLDDSQLARQAVEAVQDTFRQLCAPRQLDRSNFFEGIIDVDREVGFGEDEDFSRLEGGFGSDSGKSLEFRPTTSYGNCLPEDARESYGNGLPEDAREEGGGHSQQHAFGLSYANREIVMRERRLKFISSSIESYGRAELAHVEDFLRYATQQEPERIRTRLSHQHLHFSSRDGAETLNLSHQHLRFSPREHNEQLNSEGPELKGDLGDFLLDYENPRGKQWMPTRSDSDEEEEEEEEEEGEGRQLEDRESEWEMESRDGEGNDEDSARWKEEACGDEQEQGYALESEAENMDEAIQDMLAEMRQETVVQDSEEESVQEEEPERDSLVYAAIRNRTTDDNGNPYSLIFLGFEDLLREADGRAERERKTAEDVVRVMEDTEEAMLQQQIRCSDTEKQMQSRLNSLEMQQGRLLDMLRETEAVLATEKERRKESRTEVDRILEMLKKERVSHRETVEKLSNCVNSLMKLRGNLALQKSRSAEEGGPSYLQVVDTILEDMDRELQVNLTQWTKKSSEVDHPSSDIDELSRWKQQRDALEEERDRVEENTSSQLKRARERHEEMEALWLERETLLEQQVGCLEVELQHSETKQRRKEAEILTERVRWAEELEKHRKAWARERIAWEATVRGREERLAIEWNCLPDSSDPNHLAIVTTSGNERSLLEDSEEAAEYDFKEMEAKAVQDMATKGVFSNQNKNPSLDGKISQFCVDVGNLALGIEAGVERATEDLRARERQWETEKTEWKELGERYTKERQEMEKRVSDTLALMEELKAELSAKEATMEGEKKQIQALLMQKATDAEKLNFQLKSKEHDMEVTVQKFMDEVRLIDKEVVKERKEREQVMELHFASKRKVVTDMKEREEKWDKELEAMKQELNKAKREIRAKEKDVEELKRSSMRAPSDRERQLTRAVSSLQHEKDALAAELSKEKGEVRRSMEAMLADVWKVCEEEQIQAAVAKRLGPGEELCLQRPMWEFLWLEYCRNKGISEGDQKSVEWESAVGKIAKFEKENSEAKTVIDTLRNELDSRNEQLLQAKANPPTNWEESEKQWALEREQLTRLVESEQQKKRELVKEWHEREQQLVREKEEREKAFKLEQGESAEALSNLQGVVRELEWVLKQTKSSEANHEHEASVSQRGLFHPASKTSDLVKVHTSYLEEVDRYISELEAKMEAAEKSLRSPESVFDRKWGADPEMNLALMKIERELFSAPDAQGQHLNSSGSPEGERGYFSPHGSRDWDMPVGGFTGNTRKRMARRRGPKAPERNVCLTLNGLTTLAHDTWADKADEHPPLWQLEDRNSVSSIASWMSPRTSTEDLYSSQELPAHGVLALPPNTPPTPSRRQQKWVVDVSWLEQVRKEHAWLRQQLEIERQRVSALGRVEADNRWIEAAIIRALELKRESDSKVADMQRKVDVMEVLMSKNPICSTP